MVRAMHPDFSQPFAKPRAAAWEPVRTSRPDHTHLPDRVMAVDWSGATSGERRKIWMAEIAAGRIVRLCSGWSRPAITDELVRAATCAANNGERLVIGLDFSFSFPASFVRAHGFTSAAAVWAHWTEDRVRALLAHCEAPFWGRAPQTTKPRGNGAPPDWLRDTERTDLAGLGGAPFSIFQVMGAGAVGTASLRGFATLHALHEAGVPIWPFTNDSGGAGAVVAEIWPRTFAPAVRKSQPAARVAHLHSLGRWHAQLVQFTNVVQSSDDAFDALVSAIGMWDARAELALLPAVRTAAERLEGRIWAASR